MKVFIDTNIVIDFYAKRSDFFTPASIIIDMAYKHQIELYVSSLSFVNAFYVLNRTYKVEKIREKLSALCGVCHVSPIDEMTIKRALSLANTDFEDMVQYESAKLVDPDVIVTRNTKHFHGLDIPIKTPIDFLDEQLQ